MRVFCLAVFVLLPLPAWAASSKLPDAVQLSPDPDPHNPKLTYDECIKLTSIRPQQAMELAGKWAAIGGGEAASHCQALALIGLKKYADGAHVLEALAEKSEDDAVLRASMLGQAAQAWMLEGVPGKAYSDETAALKFAPAGSPQAAGLMIDRAATLADIGRYQDALADLDAALQIAPEQADALAFRAAAHRRLNELDLALADAEHAVKNDPGNLSALLERGSVYRAKNKLMEARQDFAKIVELAPESAEARTARKNIAQLDLKPAPAK